MNRSLGTIFQLDRRGLGFGLIYVPKTKKTYPFCLKRDIPVEFRETLRDGDFALFVPTKYKGAKSIHPLPCNELEEILERDIQGNETSSESLPSLSSHR